RAPPRPTTSSCSAANTEAGRSSRAPARPPLVEGRSSVAGGSQPRRRAVADEHFRQLDAAVLLLPVLEQRDDRAPDGDGRAVERVRRLRPLAGARAALAAHADAEATSLVVGRVRARRQLAIALLARQPR